MVFLNLSAFIKRITGRSESLLAPDLEAYHDELSSRIDGASVLVIGGAGTIGSNFIKALLAYKPAKLYVADTNENGLTELVRDLRSNPDLNIPEDFKTYPLDFSGPVFEKIYRAEGPFDMVANFAAHKHVRSEKDHYSVEAMVRNNVLNAVGLLELMAEQPPGRFFCVSTDKAANPVNVMGASKKLMEDVVLNYADRLHVSTARFANVAFSNGSLPAGFIERLHKQQPLAAPRDIRRYFVSPEESGQLCMLACVLGNNGDIFYPRLDADKDMVSFTRIAEDLLAEYGLRPDYCSDEKEAIQKAKNLDPEAKTYPVLFFPSNTTGEKPFEEFYTSLETRDEERFTSLGVITESACAAPDAAALKSDLEKLFQRNDYSKKDVVQLLGKYVPGFAHEEKDRHLDQSI
ncbi:polysaccharide biosynthesis protein [Roseivirga sp. BDSF3-8]|uniref:polysaccharide biosynthesis protein n=1 Tax=Roseivirga sp. BDSF3-8 TaxID=3241598 RepID=UPI0035321FD1